MAGNRKAFEASVLKLMARVTKGGRNRKIYEDLFAQMSDDDIEKMVVSLEEGNPLPVYVSNWDEKEMLSFREVQVLAKEYGVALETQLIITDQDTGLEFITPETYFVGVTEIRKQRQMLVKKFGAAKDDVKVDDLTGQVIGDSRGTGISNPEIQVLQTLGLTTTPKELYDVKGGDLGALDVYRKELMETGRTSTIGALKRGTGVKSLQVAHFLLRARHIDNNLQER